MQVFGLSEKKAVKGVATHSLREIMPCRWLMQQVASGNSSLCHILLWSKKSRLYRDESMTI